MGGVATYRPPDTARPDVELEDAYAVIQKCLAQKLKQCGYDGAKSSAVYRLTELVDECRLRALTQS